MQFHRLLACAALCASFASAQDAAPASTFSFSSWLGRIWTLPVFNLFVPEEPPVIVMAPPAIPEAPPCLVDPLPQIDDPAAFAFETGLAPTVDLSGMHPNAARALDRFEQIVARNGGTISLRSAYRPASYQQHLQQVWDKWIIELRYNTDPACDTLRAEVGQEFAAHRLLETQRPVSWSDHTRGIAFDAVVQLPGRKSVDRLARLAGIRRPAIASDPVHFRYSM